MLTGLKHYLARYAGRTLAREGARQRKAKVREQYIATNLELMQRYGIAPPKHWVSR